MSYLPMSDAERHAVVFDHIVRVQINGRIRATWVCETAGCPANEMRPMLHRCDREEAMAA